ncbi:MAG: hypothetical protein JSR82_08635 [Verrucomicrobia bacterium]|nr:hypothetical protein [Verrucomicrobiota bacterium]
MVRCSVCETEYPDYRTECPCCSHPAPQPPPPPAAPPPPPRIAAPPASPKRHEESGPLPRAFAPPVRPPGPTPPTAPTPISLPPPPPPAPEPKPVAVPVAPPRPAVLLPEAVLANIRTEDLSEPAPVLAGRAWRVQVLTPDASPAALPPLLTSARPWEEGFEVEVRIAETRDGVTEPLAEAWVQWRLRPAREGGEVPGRVLGGALPDRGDWTTDADGRIRFRFAPTRDHSLLFAGNRCLPQAEFEVFVLDEAGEPGAALPPVESVTAEAASFLLLWAPKFDLGVLKLPFFVALDTPLQLEPEPSEDSAPPLPWGLGGHSSAYRQLFRDGGTLALSLQAIDEGGDGLPALRRAIEHARIVVGAASAGPDEPRRLLKFSDLGEPENGGVKLTLPPSAGARSAPAAVALQADLPLHPDVRRQLLRVVEECRALEKPLASCPHLETPLPSGEGRASFRQLGETFFADAFEVLCAARQATLLAKRHGFRSTLGAMVSYLRATATVWTQLGESVEAHRRAFQALEATFLPFYRHFLLWGEVHERLAPGWKSLAAAGARLPAELRLNAPAESLLAPVHSAFARTGLERVVRPALAARLEPWQALRQRAEVARQSAETRRAAAAAALEAADLALLESVGSAERQVDELAALLAGHAAAAAPTSPELERDRAGLGRMLLTTLTELPGAFGRAERHWRARQAAELEARAAETGHQMLAHCAEAAGAQLARIDELLAAESLSPATVGRWLEEADASPEAELAARRAEHLAGLRVQGERRAESAQGLVEKLARLRERVEPLLTDQTDLRAALAREFSASQQALGNEAARTAAVVGELAEHYPARLAEAGTAVLAQRQANADALAQALRAESTAGAELLRDALRELPPLPAGLDDGFARGLEEFVRGSVEGVLALVPTGSPVLFRALGGLAEALLGHAVGALVELTARFGARAAEVVTALFDATLQLRGGAWLASALTPGALQAGMTELRKLSASPEKFFAFPYVKERVILSHLAETADHLRQNRQLPDRASEQFVEEALRTGYEYYYPNQLKQARSLLHGLCQRALSREISASAPCTRESAARAEISAAVSARLPAELATAIARGAWTEGDFAPPLTTAVSGERWSQPSLAAAAEWCGWLSAWTLRLGGISLLLAGWWHAPTRQAAATVLRGSTAARQELQRFLLACGTYPFAGAHPRDLLALHAAHGAVLFGAEPERVPANAPTDLLRGHPA